MNALPCRVDGVPFNRSLAQVKILDDEAVFRTLGNIGVAPRKTSCGRADGINLQVCRNRHGHVFDFRGAGG